MGFFGSLKNLVTGGGVKVSLEAINPARGQPFTVRVSAEVGEADCAINKVYLHLRGSEKVEVPDVEIAEKNGDKIEVHKRAISREENTFHTELTLAPASVLAAGQTYHWETQVNLPADALPSFTGKHAKHEWYLLAGLDMRGNDPDSGWVAVEIS
jgi:hypothetical protein